MTDVTTVEIPDTLDYDAGDIAEANRRDVLAEGWMLAEVVGNAKGASKKGHHRLTFRMAPVGEDDQAQASLTANLNIYLPVRNKGVPGHKAPKTLFFCGQYARNFGEDLPARPERVAKDKYDYEGDILSYKDAKEQFDKADDATMKAMIAWWNDPSVVTGRRLYIKVEHTVTGDGKTFANINETALEAPEDEEIKISDFVAGA